MITETDKMWLCINDVTELLYTNERIAVILYNHAIIDIHGNITTAFLNNTSAFSLDNFKTELFSSCISELVIASRSDAVLRDILINHEFI